MSYDLRWHIPQKVLFLEVTDDYTLDNANNVNNDIKKHLDTVDDYLSLVIDATYMNKPLNFQEIRSAQAFMSHKNMKHLYVIAQDPLIRLAVLVIFNLATAKFMLMDSREQVDKLLSARMRR